jgi:hypothetical protein
LHEKTAEGFSVSYPKLIFVMCVVHALHRVCETICVLYQNVENLVPNGKKIFVNSPVTTQLFKNKATDTPLTPTAVITCWGTWLDATVYYAENLEIFCSAANFSFLSQSITKLEKTTYLLSETIK